MKIRLVPEAEADVADAYAWYKERNELLATAFLDAIGAALTAIARHPHAFPRVHKDVRRALARRFPYGIFALLPDEVVVLACFHVARDPKSWPRRAR